MVESRVALVLQVYLADCSVYPSLTLVDGYPNDLSLATYFSESPMILEASELSESSEDTDHGEVIQYQLRHRVGRESNFFEQWKNKRCIAAVELANGEKILVGTQENPLRYTYSRNTGPQQTSETDTTMTFNTTIPVL